MAATVISSCSSPATGVRTYKVSDSTTISISASEHSTVTAAPAKVGIARSVQTSAGPVSNPLQLLDTPERITVTGPLGVMGATISVTVSAAQSPGTTPFLATYNPADDGWTAVASNYDPTSHTVSAHLARPALTADASGPHEMLDGWEAGGSVETTGLLSSIWGVLRFVKSGLEAVVKAAVDSIFSVVKLTGKAPTCNGADVEVTVSPNDGTLQFCGQDDGSTAVTLKVVSTLAFPTDLDAGSSPIALVPPDDVFGDIDQALLSASNGRLVGKVIPGGSEADVTLPLPAGQKSSVTTSLDTVSYLTGIIYSAIQVLTVIESDVGSAATKSNLAAIGRGTCAAQIAAALPTVSLTAEALKSLATLGFTCAEAVVDLGAPGVVAAVAGAVAAVFEDIVQTGFLTLESIVGWKTGGVHVLTVSRTATASCQAPLLFQAAVAKEHFNPDDPSYAGFGANGNDPGAYDVTCDDGWAVALISRPNVGTTDGFTVFTVQGGAWVEFGQMGGSDAACQMVELGVPESIALDLSHGVADSPEAGCTLATAAPPGIPVLEISSPGETFDGIKPSTIDFSNDSTNIITNLTWSSWTTTGASGQGTWEDLSCNPDCATGPETPYPASITLSDPVDGHFTQLTETTTGPDGFTNQDTYPNPWALGAN